MTTEAAAEQREPPDGIRVRGEALDALPEDLYIPPDALRVILESFEGPLDLLLYLIRRQNLDILDIPVGAIAEQYFSYIELMQDVQIELAGEYLLMAAMLAEIKSRMLLPRPEPEDDEEGEDPRAELVRRLQEYERFKTAAENIEAQPRVGRDITTVQVPPEQLAAQAPPPQPELNELLAAFRDAMARAELYAHHQIERETLSVRERMTGVLAQLQDSGAVRFTHLFPCHEGRLGLVVTFIAVLELVRESLVDLSQDEAFGEVALQAVSARAANESGHESEDVVSADGNG